MKHKSLFLLPLLLLILALFPMSALADESGQCGEDTYWTLTEDGTLYITGTGAIRDWAFQNNYAISEVLISEGVTSIGEYAFSGCEFLAYITLPSTLEDVGFCAFSMCPILSTASYDGSELDWMMLVYVNAYNTDLTNALNFTEPDKTPASAGWVMEDGYWRLYQDGTPYTGHWYQYGSNWYYLDRGYKKFNEIIEDNGRSYYIGMNGVWRSTPGPYTYLTTVEFENGSTGSTYKTILISDSGTVFSEAGWHKAGGSWYYIDEYGYLLHNRYTEIDGVGYAFDDDYKWITTPGWIELGGYWVDDEFYPYLLYADGNGHLVSGWKQKDGKWFYLIPHVYANASGGLYPVVDGFYYFGVDGAMQTGVHEIDGVSYDFGTTGKLTLPAGWNQIYGEWVYVNADGSLKTGWYKENGIWYYFDKEFFFMYHLYDGEENYFERKIDGKVYYFGKDGAMKANFWREISWYDDDLEKEVSEWYYYDASGAMTKGWKQINGSWYYFVVTYEDDTYLLAPMVTGWYEVDGGLYYFGDDGAMRSGWKQIDGEWYYFGNTMATGWKQIGGSWYYFGSDGAMKSGWQEIGGKWYYLSNTMVTGWKQISGSWYYFGSDGAMRSGWQNIGGTWYYFNNTMTTGWKQISGTWYYFKSNGAMAASETLNIGGTNYSFAASGAWIQ